MENTCRILHVLGGMNRGGVETWLMHVLRHIDRERFRFDFLVHTTKPCAYDDEIRAFGSKIFSCMSPSRPYRYARNFGHILMKHGPYDVVHSHVHHFSGYVLRQAQLANIPIRIAHSHNDINFSNKKFLRKGYSLVMKELIKKNATLGLACSSRAAVSLFGRYWENDLRWKVHFCGVDLSPYNHQVERDVVLSEFNIPSNAFVVGHVGRFANQKNHSFLLDIAKEVVHRHPNVFFLLVGEGSLLDNMKRKAKQIGIYDNVIFTGSRPDVPRLMLGAMDIFLFPSLYEGLGLVLIEAQASGLPCVFSDVVAQEAEVVPELISRVSLQDSAKVWAQKILVLEKQQHLAQSVALCNVAKSPFDIRESNEKLCLFYAKKS